MKTPPLKGTFHKSVTDPIANQCQSVGWQIDTDNALVFHNAGNYAIYLEIEIPELTVMLGRLRLFLGITLYESDHFADQMYVGVIEDNRRITIARVHRRYDEPLSKTAKNFAEYAWHVPETVRLFKDTRLNKDQVFYPLIKAGQKKLLPWSRTGRIIEWAINHGLPVDAWDLLRRFHDETARGPAHKRMRSAQLFRSIIHP